MVFHIQPREMNRFQCSGLGHLESGKPHTQMIAHPLRIDNDSDLIPPELLDLVSYATPSFGRTVGATGPCACQFVLASFGRFRVTALEVSEFVRFLHAV